MKQEKLVQQPSKKKEESLSYAVEVRDKTGKILQQFAAPSRSYVRQWNQMANVQARQANRTLTKTDGSTFSSYPNGSMFRVRIAGMYHDQVGLQIGKGTTAVTINDYALETQILHGTGTDEFSFQAVTLTTPAVVGSTCSFTVKRIFVNNSGATISGIREIGAYVGAPQYVLGFRDVLPSAVTVPDGGSITVTYTIAVTV